jgi:hypothetical protein
MRKVLSRKRIGKNYVLKISLNWKRN